jgi:hypothetical protein
MDVNVVCNMDGLMDVRMDRQLDGSAQIRVLVEQTSLQSSQKKK